MTQVRNNLIPPNIPLPCASEVTTLVQALAIELEERETDDRTSARESAANERAARRDEIREMRREANIALVGGVVQSAAKAASAAASLGSSSPSSDSTSPSTPQATPPATTQPPSTHPVARVADVIATTTTTVTDRLAGDARADQADARLRADTAEDAEAAALDSAKRAHDVLDRLRSAASQIAEARAETQRRLLA
jgi:hypothetical protein